MDNSKVAPKVRPFCSPSGRSTSNANARTQSQPNTGLGQTRSIAEWERIFTSRKRTILHKVCELDAITNCTIALTIASPYGGVWYYASTDAVKMCMAASGLINKDSQQVTIDSIDKKAMTENFTLASNKPKDTWPPANQRSTFGSIPVNPYLYNPLNMMHQPFNNSMPIPYGFQSRPPHINHDLLNNISTLNEVQPVTTPPQNISTGTPRDSEPIADKPITQVIKQEVDPTVHLIRSNSSSSESESTSSSESSEDDAKPAEKLSVPKRTSTIAKNVVAPKTRSNKAIKKKAKTTKITNAKAQLKDKKKKVINKVKPVPRKESSESDSSSESSSSSSSSSDSSSSSSSSESEDEEQDVQIPVVKIRPLIKVKSEPGVSVPDNKPIKKEIVGESHDTACPQVKKDNAEKSAIKRKNSFSNAENEDVKSKKKRAKSQQSSAEEDLANIPDHLKNKFALFLKAEVDKKPKKELMKKKTLTKNKLKNKEQHGKDETDAKCNRNDKVHVTTKPKVSDEKLYKNAKLGNATENKNHLKSHETKPSHGTLVCRIKTEFESKLSAKNIQKYPACQKLVKDKEDQNKFVYIPSLLNCNCFKNLREAITNAKLTTILKKDIFTKALSGCKSLELNKSGNSIKRIDMKKRSKSLEPCEQKKPAKAIKLEDEPKGMHPTTPAPPNIKVEQNNPYVIPPKVKPTEPSNLPPIQDVNEYKMKNTSYQKNNTPSPRRFNNRQYSRAQKCRYQYSKLRPKSYAVLRRPKAAGRGNRPPAFNRSHGPPANNRVRLPRMASHNNRPAPHIHPIRPTTRSLPTDNHNRQRWSPPTHNPRSPRQHPANNAPKRSHVVWGDTDRDGLY